MKTPLTILVILFMSTICHSQIANLMRSFNGKNIDFKTHYDSIKAQYNPDSNIVILDNKNVLNLDSVNPSYRGEKYNRYKSIKTKVDFYANGKDTLIYTYVFYNNRLFQVDIFTNIDSIYKSMGKDLEKFFKVGFIGKGEGIQKGDFHRYVVKRRTSITSKFQYDRSSRYKTFFIILTYDPVRNYFPLWCGTGRSRNWEKKLCRKLNCH